MSVLEPGSGPGFITEQLLELLPHSQITALDTDPILNQRASDYLQGKGDGRLQIIEASVMNTGLPDNSVDFAITRLLFMHLPDPIGAAKEILRVLKPGGKLVIIDVDDAMWGMSDPPMPEIGMIMDIWGQAQAARGGNRLIGRQLGRIFAAAGFQSFDMEAVVFSSEMQGVETFIPQIDADRMIGLVQAGLLPGQVLEGLRASQERFFDSEYPFIMMLTFLACGEKPGDGGE